MSPQLMWSIAGLLLTVLTLGGITLSSSQSVDASKSKMAASEISNIGMASKLWLVNDSTDGLFTNINAAGVNKYIPELVVAGTGPTSTFASKAIPGITYLIATATSVSAGDSVSITTNAIGTEEQEAAVLAALQGKACVVTNDAPNDTITYVCRG